MSNFNQVVGEFIKQQRLSKNPRMTQSMLAKELGVTFQQVQKYETGANGMSLQKFLLAMKFLQCNLNRVPFILDTLSYDVPITQEIDHAEPKNFKDLVGEFKTFHQKNPEVYKLFVQFTLQAINKGHAKLSSEMIINRIRWETSVITTDKDYKINNDYKPFYSRMFMAQFPKYDYFFQKRGSYADQIDWRSYVVQSDHQSSEVTQTIS